MDCMDCHNRPTHTYQAPDDALDLGEIGLADAAQRGHQRYQLDDEDAEDDLIDHMQGMPEQLHDGVAGLHAEDGGIEQDQRHQCGLDSVMGDDLFDGDLPRGLLN